MINFLLEYWVQAICTVIAAGLGIFFKKFASMYKKEINAEKTQIQNHLKKLDEFDSSYAEQMEKIKEDIREVQNEFKEATKIQNQALLSIQGSNFRNKCRRYLDPNYQITLQDYEQLNSDYGVYKALGGNSGGDQLYSLIKEKFEGQKVFE